MSLTPRVTLWGASVRFVNRAENASCGPHRPTLFDNVFKSCVRGLGMTVIVVMAVARQLIHAFFRHLVFFVVFMMR